MKCTQNLSMNISKKRLELNIYKGYVLTPIVTTHTKMDILHTLNISTNLIKNILINTDSIVFNLNTLTMVLYVTNTLINCSPIFSDDINTTPKICEFISLPIFTDNQKQKIEKFLKENKLL